MRGDQAFEDFHGRAVDGGLDLDLADPAGDLVEVGIVQSISYRSDKDGEEFTFVHAFRRGCGPILTRDEEGAPYLLGGNYRVTDHGMEDGLKRWKEDWTRPGDGAWVLGELAELVYLAPDEDEPIQLEWDIDDGPPLAVRGTGELLLGAAFTLPDEDNDEPEDS